MIDPIVTRFPNQGEFMYHRQHSPYTNHRGGWVFIAKPTNKQLDSKHPLNVVLLEFNHD